MNETLAALLCKAMEENAVYDNHAVEPVCEALAASLVLDGVRVDDEGQWLDEKRLARAIDTVGTYKVSSDPDTFGKAVPKTPSEIAADVVRALAAAPTPPEIDVEPAPRCGVHTFVTTDVCGCKS